MCLCTLAIVDLGEEPGETTMSKKLRVVPIIRVTHLSSEELRAYRLADNKLLRAFRSLWKEILQQPECVAVVAVSVGIVFGKYPVNGKSTGKLLIFQPHDRPLPNIIPCFYCLFHPAVRSGRKHSREYQGNCINWVVLITHGLRPGKCRQH